MTCILEGGCPCTNTVCKNWGDCAKCIKRHTEEVDLAVACQRDKKPVRDN